MNLKKKKIPEACQIKIRAALVRREVTYLRKDSAVECLQFLFFRRQQAQLKWKTATLACLKVLTMAALKTWRIREEASGQTENSIYDVAELLI